MDLDLDDLGLGDAPSKAAPRPSKFQPKSSKLKPIPKPKSEPIQKPKSEPVPKPETKLVDVKKQEDIKPSFDDIVEITMDSDGEPLAKLGEEEEMELDPMEEDKEEDEEDKEEEKEEEEDTVVREIDVYFTPPPLEDNTQLYVVQYPLRPCWRPYELNDNCLEIRVKPKSSQVEVDLSLDVNQNFNADIADRYRIHKQTLSSSKPSANTEYAVGILKGNSLHLNPVHAVVQLRPSLDHLNSGRPKKNIPVTQNVEGTVSFAEETSTRGLSKKQGAPKVTASEEVENESWVVLDYRGRDSHFSTAYRERMTCQKRSAIPFSMSSYEYLNSLCPVLAADKDRDKGPSKSLLRKLPLEERFKKWISEGPPVNRFSSLKHLAPDDSDENVLEVIQHHAILLEGLWVARTSLLHSTARITSNEALARDKLLLLFKKNGLLIKHKTLVLPEYRKIQEELKRYVNLFAVHRPSFQDWKFKEPPDESFKKGHPDIVKKQENDWETMEKRVEKVLPSPVNPVTKSSSSPSISNKPRTSVQSDLGAKTRINGAPSSGTVTVPDEAREAMAKALQVLLRKHNVCSWKLICEDLRENALLRSSFLKADARGAVAIAREADTLPELQAVISQVAINIHGVYVLESIGDPTLDPLRKVVIDLFSAKEPNAKLKKADIFEAAKIRLKRDITPREYTQVLNQLCVSVRGSGWIMKSGDGNPE